MHGLFQKILFNIKNILNKKLIKIFFLYLLIYILILYAVRNGFGQYWDLTFPYFKEHIKNIFLNRSFSWTELNFGQPLDYSTDYILRFFLSLFDFLNPEIFRYCLYILLFSFSSFGVFLIINKKLTSTWAFFLGLIALINPAIFYKFIAGHFNYSVSYLIFIYLIYYLLFKFKKDLKSALIVGLLLSFIGAQIQFFVIGFLFVILFFCFNFNKFNLKHFIIICLLPFLINLMWLSNFILGVNEMSEVSGAAAKVSFADSQKMDFLNVFNLSFSKATLIDRFYQIQYLYFFTVFFIFLFLFLLKNKIKDKIASFFFTCLMILMILSTGIYFSFQIWPIKILYPMFREVGHFAPLIILLLIFSISTVIKKGKMKTVFFYFIIIFFVINLIQFYKYPHAINFSHVRSQFNDFEKNNKEDNSVYRILYYPFFGQYSISDVNVKTDNGFLLNNTGYDSFIKFSGKDFAHNPTASNFKNSIQYKLLKTYDIENLRKYNIKYIYDFSDIYESNYEKYVPSHVYDNNLSLIKNDKDFFNKLIKNNPGQLERINENILRVKDYAPRIFSLDNIFLLLNSDNEKYDISNFAKNILKKDFYYIASNDAANNNTTATFPVLSDIFKDVQKNSVKDGRVLDKNRLLNKNNLNFLYINEAKTSLYCLTDNDKIKFYTKHGNNLLINNKHLDIKNIKEEILFEDTLDANKKYYIYLGTQLILIQKDNEQNLGIIGKSDTQRLYSTNNKNFIPNASFQEGLWDKEVGDCNAYDNNPVLNMKIGITGNAFAGIEKLDSINSEENQYLQLEAIRHIACTTNEFLVQANADYLFSFDYQSPNAKNAGYYLQFNDLDKTTISERIFISDTNWNTFSKKIKTPVGATSARLYLYAYSADEKTNIINRYDNFSLLKLDLEKEIKIEYRPEFEKKEIELTGDNIFEYVDSYYDYKNIVPNGSFENGLWSETVGDCNNYDDNPKLAIKLINDSSDGKNSLQLEAERHIACADTVFAIKENTDYLLSFDFQSRNAEAAGYYLQFNNEYKTIISEIIDIENHDWQEFAKKIKTPIGADSARLYIYGYSKDKKTNIITRYDNFQFIELPDLEDKYYLVSDPLLNLKKPKSVEFEIINPSKKIVHIKGAETPFFLAMSESYHDQWQLQINNKKARGILSKWLPFAKPDKISNANHLKLNNFLNAWYVDTDEICKDKNFCSKNPDGTYDIKMIIEFWPQRWFYLGLLISGMTFLGCIIYLAVDFVKRRKQRFQRFRRFRNSFNFLNVFKNKKHN